MIWYWQVFVSLCYVAMRIMEIVKCVVHVSVTMWHGMFRANSVMLHLRMSDDDICRSLVLSSVFVKMQW